jgi:hypothetical protein
MRFLAAITLTVLILTGCQTTAPQSFYAGVAAYSAKDCPTAMRHWRPIAEQGEERSITAAKEHLDAIQRFGRFPHRNAPMGRTSTADEMAYLKDPPKWGMSAIKNADPDEQPGET